MLKETVLCGAVEAAFAAPFVLGCRFYGCAVLLCGKVNYQKRGVLLFYLPK